MRAISPLLVLACLLGAFLQGSEGKSKLVCYSELWARDRPSPKYDLELLPPYTCDYLILVYLTMDANTWGLRLHSGYGEVDPDELHKGAAARDRSPGMKVLLSVGGWEDGVAKYSDMMSEENRRQAFVRSVEQVLETYNLDGLELHWLYPGAVWRGGKSGDKENLVQLVKELKTAFKRKNWILTASVPPDETALRDGFNVPRLNSLLHQMHVRTLDLRGDWTHAAAGHCPLYANPWETPDRQKLNVNGSVSLYLSEGASPRKLVPTFPFYGRTYTLRDSSKTAPGSPISGPGRATHGINAAGLQAYFEICDGIQNKRLTRYFQEGSETPYAVGDDQWIGYDDEESLLKKIKFANKKKLGGVAVFAIDMDDFSGRCGQSHFLLNKMVDYMIELDPSFPDPRKQPSS